MKIDIKQAIKVTMPPAEAEIVIGHIETLQSENTKLRIEIENLHSQFTPILQQNARLLEALKDLKRQVTDLLIPAIRKLPAGQGIDFPTLMDWGNTVEKVDVAIAEADTKSTGPTDPITHHITAIQLQEFMSELDYTRQIGHLQNAIRQFVSASQFAMRLLSQNEGDALAQSCITKLAQAINAVTTYGNGPIIQERPRPELKMPDYDTND